MALSIFKYQAALFFNQESILLHTVNLHKWLMYKEKDRLNIPIQAVLYDESSAN